MFYGRTGKYFPLMPDDYTKLAGHEYLPNRFIQRDEQKFPDQEKVKFSRTIMKEFQMIKEDRTIDSIYI